MIGVVFDFDGVLVDSYRGIDQFYKLDLAKRVNADDQLVEYFLYIDYLCEMLGLLREDWWFKYIPGLTEELFDELITKYWERRIENQVLLPCSKYVLEELSSEGVKLFSVSFRDDIYGLKKYRIEVAGVSELFEEILVVQEDCSDYAPCIKRLLDKHSFDELLYVDDKLTNLYKLSAALGSKVTCVHYPFLESLHGYPVVHPRSSFKTLYSLCELVNVL